LGSPIRRVYSRWLFIYAANTKAQIKTPISLRLCVSFLRKKLVPK
jgi:hypothetical protein